ncbi:hypothetical protein thsps21_37310 [Pseudomonas sp. No.21]|nr:hypothetical protein TUM20249_15750 [Pseudomonas tohonis]
MGLSALLLLENNPLSKAHSVAVPDSEGDAADSAPSEGRVESSWKGLSDMDVARALPGQGWPVSACPWNDDGVRGPDAVGPDAGASFLVPFQRLEKGLAREGETKNIR